MHGNSQSNFKFRTEPLNPPRGLAEIYSTDLSICLHKSALASASPRATVPTSREGKIFEAPLDMLLKRSGNKCLWFVSPDQDKTCIVAVGGMGTGRPNAYSVEGE